MNEAGLNMKSGPCRALLIQPPSGGKTITEFPLNLAHLAAALEAAGHQVRCLDMTAPYGRRQWSDLAREVADFEPHLIGLTLYIDYILDKYAFIGRLKREFSRPVIVGGPHASCLPEEALRFGADCVCVGEGERTIVEYADRIMGDGRFDQVPGLVFKQNGRLVRTEPRAPIKDLDDLPFPAYDHFPVRDYAGTDDPNFHRLFWSMFTSRGCPFNCIYCVSRKVFDNRWRMRSAENIFAEIEFLARRYGVTHVAFQDDEPMINQKRILELCDLLLTADLGVKISCRGRIDSVRADVLSRMRQAGFYFMAFGTESGDDDTLKRINKKYRRHQMAAGFQEIVRSGFTRINVSILSGFPWEGDTHYQNDLGMLRSIPRELEFSVGVATVIPYPGTPIYEQYKDEYGFAEWWIQEPAWELTRAPDTVFFRNWLPESNLDRHHNRDFWRYSRRTRAALRRLAIRAETEGLKSRYDRRRLWLLLALARLSLWLYRRSPRLERLAFRPLSGPRTVDRLRRFFRGRKGEGVVF